MDPNLIALMGLILMFLLIFLNMPISFAMLIAGFLGLLLIIPREAVFGLLSSNVVKEFSSYSLSVIPLYMFMGEIVFRTGISKNLFETAYKWVGNIKGGMLATVIIASAGFASICGSNSATAATIGTIALPELKKYKYDESLSTGTVATGGTLGVIIPPSTVLIVIAIMTQQSISDLFIGIFIPGLVLVALLLGAIFFLCSKQPELGPVGPRTGLREKIKSLAGVAPILLLFTFVLGGLFWGLFTPTESGAFGAFGALVITFLTRKLNWEAFQLAVVSTLRSSAMVMMLVMGAIVFGRFLAATRLPYNVAEFINALKVSPLIILALITVIFLIGGALMDALGFLLIALPVFYPSLLALGYDPVWIAVFLCILTSLGAITPPIGVNAFVVQGLSPSTSIVTVFKGIRYFLYPYALFIVILIAFPGITLLFVK